MGLSVAAQQSAAENQIRLPQNPQISPSGTHVAFDWRGDVWIAELSDGRARRLTSNPSTDSSPFFSPDGQTIAFMSNRSGVSQVYLMPRLGGIPRQLTLVTTSKSLLGFASDGRGVLLRVSTDRFYTRAESSRLILFDLETEQKTMLMDCGFSEASVSPDGQKVLFTRGRASWNRKGYQGSQALQLWLVDLSKDPQHMVRLDSDEAHYQNISKKAPLWMPDGKEFIFVSDPEGTFDAYRGTTDSWNPTRVSNLSAIDGTDDGLSSPSLSADGKTLLGRRRFDLITIASETGVVTPVRLTAVGERTANRYENRLGTGATSVAFTDDGKQIAFVSEGDVFVMDRILREPVRLTNSPQVESNLVFSRDGKTLYWVSDAVDHPNIWKATHDGAKGYWWLASTFDISPITHDKETESGLSLSPDGLSLAYVRDTDIYILDIASNEARQLTSTWNTPRFSWAPDSKWIVYTTMDDDYNSDVFIQDVAREREPFNLSRHPDRDGDAVWSPDGKRIAFTGRRDGEEVDIYHVILARGDAEETSRDRKIKEAMDAMKKAARGSKGASTPKTPSGNQPVRGGRGGAQRRRRRPGGGQPNRRPTGAQADGETSSSSPNIGSKALKEPVKVVIDFEGLCERVKRIRIADSSERSLMFSPDGKRLLFSATVDGQSGVYAVEFPKLEKPKKVADRGLSSARWLAKSDEIVGLSSSASSGESTPRRGPRRRGSGRRMGGGGDIPASMSNRGELKSYSFTVRVVRDWGALREAAFDGAWRVMRDRFYDPNMNNRDWDGIRTKYRSVAAACLGAEEFSTMVNMMLGELNASHMGHRGGSGPIQKPSNSNAWTESTQALGLRTAMTEKGAVVESVIPKGPCSQKRSAVVVGETIVAVDGVRIQGAMDLDRALTRPSIREVLLTVTTVGGESRDVKVMPVASVSGLLYDEWTGNNRRLVESLSGGRLGYLHIRAMNMSSLRELEEDVFAAGQGKEGLVIDVRFNGGGSTTDHVLTVLTQPEHAVTVSPGSGEGYPQDRKIYASWRKPIVLMCNEYSFSNAEILSHAIKHLERGRVVGMRTAGGVISTSSARLIDGSSVRMPTRGWFLKSDGADMELNGCEPDICVWNKPGGRDDQLREAVRALTEDVKAAANAPRVKPKRAAELRK